jgi:hypothetical protein
MEIDSHIFFPTVYNVLRAPEFLVLRCFQIGQDFKKSGLKVVQNS